MLYHLFYEPKKHILSLFVNAVKVSVPYSKRTYSAQNKELTPLESDAGSLLNF